MNEFIKYESFVNKDIINEFFPVKPEKDYTLYEHAIFNCMIDEMIANAYLFAPDIIEVNGYIFLKDFWNHDERDSVEALNIIEKQYNYNKKMIEMSVNTWSLGGFFVGCDSKLLDNEKVIRQFGEVLVHFWKQRVNELFPEKNIVVELGQDLMGEYGLSITLYENK